MDGNACRGEALHCRTTPGNSRWKQRDMHAASSHPDAQNLAGRGR